MCWQEYEKCRPSHITGLGTHEMTFENGEQYLVMDALPRTVIPD